MAGERQLDEKDLEIVQLLQENAWLTHTRIGEIVHLSASAVQRRVERLRSKGVITGARATVDQSLLNRSLCMVLLLELHDDSRPSLTSLVDELNSRPEVTHADLVAGKFDVVVTVDCEDTDAFSEFAMNSINENTNIRHCWTLTRLKKLI